MPLSMHLKFIFRLAMIEMDDLNMRVMMSEPLVQFMGIGLAVHLLAKVILPPAALDAGYEIVVNEARLSYFMQTQARAFQSEDAKSLLASLSKSDKDRLIRDYVRGEVLFREAMAMRLDENDEIIRRRLIQKMEYIAQGFFDEISPLDKNELLDFYESNMDDYRVPAQITFTHVFVAHDGRDETTAKRLAIETKNELNKSAIPFEQSGQFGERFLYNRNYAERSDIEVTSHFGESFKRQIFDLNPSDLWQGPVRSNFGYHLILLKKLKKSFIPKFDEVIAAVVTDAQRQESREVKREAIKKLVDKYRVTVKLE